MNDTHVSYRIIDHTADLGIIVKGPDEKGLFINAAYAMTDLMVKGDITTKTANKDVSIKGEDFSDLMVRWLGEILYLFAGEMLLIDTIEIKAISSTHLNSQLGMTPFDPVNHEVVREIKAVTYHQISVDRLNDGWQARVIFDI
jgi:SHS2 domain-containing protein